MDEAELIDQVIAGKAYAGTFLVSLYGQRLMGYCRSIAPDLSDPDREFICETAVETAVRKLDGFDPARGSLVGWLRGFVRYGAMNWRRSHGAQIAASLEELDLPEPSRDEQAVANDDTTEGLRGLLRQEVGKLAEEDQVLLALRYRELLPTKEIADRLSLSDDAVRKRLSRTVRRLRSALPDPAEPSERDKGGEAA